MTDRLLRWARSEEEAKLLQAQGWRVCRQRLDSHHDARAILLEKDSIPVRLLIALRKLARTAGHEMPDAILERRR